MADEEKKKAEKLAAAKKRVEALKKQKAKKGASKKVEEESSSVAEAETEAPTADAEATSQEPEALEAEEEEKKDSVDSPTSPPLQRNPSLSLQSKMRSSSFRQSSGAGLQSPSVPMTPGFGTDGDSASSIYLKQASRIDELEKENKRLAKEATDGERRYKKAEEELEVLREAETETATPAQKGSEIEEVEDLKSEIASLQRQNTQLLAKSTRSHGSSPSISVPPPQSSLAAELASKSTTIESMELEISSLRTQILRLSTGTSATQEQILALEENLVRSQKAAELAQTELTDLKKNLDRTTERAVLENSSRISAETKILTLTRESEESKTEISTLKQKVEALEKKISTLTNLHKENDTRAQASRKEKEKIEREASELRSKHTTLENENARLKEERDRLRKKQAEGIDDTGLDELEDEERLRLEKKVRDLEAEVFELRRGVWKEKRSALDGTTSVYNQDNDYSGGNGSGLMSPGGGFSTVDLGERNAFGSISHNRRRSTINQHHPKSGGGVGQFISSGFSAIAGNITGASAANAGGDENDGFLDDDDDMEFDEDAFRIAQEEEMKKRIERVKEVKRKLRDWSGWRLDLVENRRGGGEGAGEMFEI